MNVDYEIKLSKTEYSSSCISHFEIFIECKIVLEYSECYIVYESDIVHDCDIILEYG
jgi:hypothetical protein